MSTTIRTLLLCSLCLSWFTVATAAEPTVGFQFRAVDDKSLGLWESGRPVFVYNHGEISHATPRGSRPRACYMHPLYGLDGEVLTDDFPKDHPYHRGVYCAWTHIKLGGTEYDLWSNQGDMRQVFQRWLKQDATSERAQLGIENSWKVGDKVLVREEVWIDVHPQLENGRAIDFRFMWTPIGQSMTLSGAEGKSYGGFNCRFKPTSKCVISVREGSELPDGITAPAGRTSGDLLVTRLPWVDFTDDFGGNGKLSGAAVFVHPQHADYPPTWMTRHYGLISVGWPGVAPQTFPADKPIECRYRLWIHRGHPTAKEIDAVYAEFR